MKLITLSAICATLVLAGCNAMTKTSDKIFYKQSNFSLDESTEYPVGEGPEYDHDAKHTAALTDMQKTQETGAQRPNADSTVEHDDIEQPTE